MFQSALQVNLINYVTILHRVTHISEERLLITAAICLKRAELTNINLLARVIQTVKVIVYKYSAMYEMFNRIIVHREMICYL